MIFIAILGDTSVHDLTPARTSLSGRSQGCECSPDIRSLLTHASGIARRANASAFAREGDEKVMPAFIAKGTGKAVGEDTAREILAKIMFHIGGHSVAQGVLPALLREIGLYVLLHRLIEHGSLRASAPINAWGVGALRFARDTSVGRRHPCRLYRFPLVLFLR
jgi:hypothetical protein